MKSNIFVLLIVLASLTGCATVPKDARSFSLTEIPSFTKDEVMLIVFRQVTPPTGFSLKLFINDAFKAQLPNNSFTWVKLKAGPTKIKVEYPAISMSKPIVMETIYEGGSCHYVEIAGGIGSIIPALYYIEVWDDLKEWPKEDAVNVLTKCCRYVSGPVKSE